MFDTGTFTLHGGQESQWKIECDALTEADWKTLAAMIAERQTFSDVEGVPSGGWSLADALVAYRSPEGPLLIVDDVLTTGVSMETQRADREAVGYVVFARGPCPPWVQALFTLDAK